MANYSKYPNRPYFDNTVACRYCGKHYATIRSVNIHVATEHPERLLSSPSGLPDMVPPSPRKEEEHA